MKLEQNTIHLFPWQSIAMEAEWLTQAALGAPPARGVGAFSSYDSTRSSTSFSVRLENAAMEVWDLHQAREEWSRTQSHEELELEHGGACPSLACALVKRLSEVCA